MSFFSKIRGTYYNIFQIGKNGPNIRQNAGVLEARNAADSAYQILRALDPVGVNDLVTLGYFNSNNAAATGLTVVKLPLLQATKVSTTAIPDNAIVFWAILDVLTAYDPSTLWSVARTGDGTKVLIASGDNDPETVNTYQVPQTTDWGSTGAGTVTATITGTPAGGTANLYIAYASPNDIS